MPQASEPFTSSKGLFMIARSFLILSFLLLSGTVTATNAERMLSMKIGMTWPRALLSTGMPTGDAEVNYGIIVDNKVALGVSGNFLWNVQSKVDTVGATGHLKIISAQQSYMFPIMGFFQLDPVPDLIVHPVATFKIGYNSMIYSYTESDNTGGNEKPLSPYFYGLIIKAGAEALYDLGERSSLFLGMEYRWADTKTNSNASDWFDKRNMGGIGLFAGFRLIL
jgi:hypothetical protein